MTKNLMIYKHHWVLVKSITHTCAMARLKHNTPFFLGPLHTTASSLFWSRNPMDMTAKFCELSENTGTHLYRTKHYINLIIHHLVGFTPYPSEHWWMVAPPMLSMRGTLGPHRSISNMPTWRQRTTQIKMGKHTKKGKYYCQNLNWGI